MKQERLGVVNPFYQRVGKEYLARREQEKLNPKEDSIITPEVNQPLNRQKSDVEFFGYTPYFDFGFMTGEYGKTILHEYEDRVKKDYGSVNPLKVLNWDSKNEVVVGSNPFAVVLMNKILAEEGLRTATQIDLERIIGSYPFFLMQNNEDTGLVLREWGQSRYIENSLRAQIKARNVLSKTPIMIPLTELDLVKDKESPYRLTFKLKDSANIFYDLSILNKDVFFYYDPSNIKSGLPFVEDNSSGRYLCIRNDGLARFSMNSTLNIDTSSIRFSLSDNENRIVIIKDKAGDKK